MRHAGRESWQVSHDTNQALNTALFLRDTLALSVDTVPELPGLDPPVPVHIPPNANRARAAEEWLEWWADILDHTRGVTPNPADPTGPSLSVRPALRAAIVALAPRAATYAATHPIRPATLPTADVVKALESAFGPSENPFHLAITAVPVQGLIWERLTGNHVIASANFLADHAKTATALRTTIQTLAWPSTRRQR
ncbi:hypothetical protein [Actinosynnema sp. NPDC020468]|uniref:hypothetical protein n=1 Tax=Actinosynnema sp. NPDC020468 TaxID=3154488 RepID=UPI0033FFB3BF